MPTHLELIKSALAESDGRVTVEAVQDRIHGDRSTRAALAGYAVALAAFLDGEWLVARA